MASSTIPSSPAPPPSPVVQQEKDWHHYLALYRATVTGDWDTAKKIFDGDPEAIKARIVFSLETTLHVAVGTGNAIHFVSKLVNIMPDELLRAQDQFGYTVLHAAALAGNTAAAKILVGRCPDLLYVPDIYSSVDFPVHMAARSANRETLWYLISQTRDDVLPNPYTANIGVALINFVIDAGFFDMALYLAGKYPHMTTSRPGNCDSALGRIARQQSAFRSGENFSFLERFVYSRIEVEKTSQIQFTASNTSDTEVGPTFKNIMVYGVACVRKIRRRKKIHQQAMDLVKCLCKNMESLDYNGASLIYAQVMLTAARFGIHEVIEEIVATFPAAIYSQDSNTKQYIFHVAAENRCEKVFNLIYQLSGRRHQLSDLLDSSGNNVLHLAARLAPPHKLNLVSGAALQMQRELQWFQEVRKFLHPHFRERENEAGKTARMVFTEEHMKLKSEGEKWMKDTANSCTIAAALIATVVFAAAITVPGGNEDDTGFPIFSRQGAGFVIFAVSDAISLFTSTTSLLMFLSILTSRYAEQDFLHALPKRLCIGLVTLFISISFMMAAFSATLYLVFGRKKAWILIPVAGLACLPVTSFVLLQFPLLVDVISSTYGRGIFGKQSNRPFY